MAWDPEPGQDDLVKEDKASANIKRALRRSSKTDKPKDDDLYTDRHAGAPESFEPNADSSRKAKRLRSQGPVRTGPIEKLKNGVGSFRQTWQEAVSQAEQRQQARRNKKQ